MIPNATPSFPLSQEEARAKHMRVQENGKIDPGDLPITDLLSIREIIEGGFTIEYVVENDAQPGNLTLVDGYHRMSSLYTLFDPPLVNELSLGLGHRLLKGPVPDATIHQLCRCM